MHQPVYIMINAMIPSINCWFIPHFLVPFLIWSQIMHVLFFFFFFSGVSLCLHYTSQGLFVSNSTCFWRSDCLILGPKCSWLLYNSMIVSFSNITWICVRSFSGFNYSDIFIQIRQYFINTTMGKMGWKLWNTICGCMCLCIYSQFPNLSKMSKSYWVEVLFFCQRE